MANAARLISALADPTRRAVLERLKEGPRPVGEIAQGLPVTRPAVSQHLKVLKEAGLVSDRSVGTRRIYYIDPKGLGAMRAWLDQFWGAALDSFKLAAEAEAEKFKKKDSESTRRSARHRCARAFSSRFRRIVPSTSSRTASANGGRRRTKSAPPISTARLSSRGKAVAGTSATSTAANAKSARSQPGTRRHGWC